MKIIKVNKDVIGKFSFPGDHEKFYQSIKCQLDTLFSRENHWTGIEGGVSSFNESSYLEEDSEISQWPEMKSFQDQVWPNIKAYAREVGINSDQFKIRTTWANIYRPGGKVTRHRHVYPDKRPTYSLICCLKKPPNSGNLFVSIPGANDNMIYEVDYDEGDVVIFPGRRLHWSGTNLSDDDRVLIAFDWYQC